MNASLNTAKTIAGSSLKRGRRSTMALLIFVLSLSFINIMFVSGILGGLTRGIVQTLIDTYTAHITIDPQELPRPKDSIPKQDDLRAQIQGIPGVIATARHDTIVGTIAYDKDKNGNVKYVSAPVVGVDPAEEQKVTSISKTIVAGSYLDGLRDDEIVLGAGIAGGYNLPEATDLGGVRVGDKVTITYNKGIARTYTVKGIFLVVIGSVANQAFVSSREAESILSEYNTATQILVRVDTSRRSLTDVVADIRRIAPQLKVRTYEDLLSLIAPILSAFDLISYIVTFIGIIVATITLFVLMYIHALNQRRQIGVLRAIGIDQRVIVLSYAMQALFYVSCSVLLGLGIVFFVLVPHFVSHPLNLPIGQVSLTFTAGRMWGSIGSFIVAGLIAGIVPSRIVAREGILKAIWG